MASSPSKREDSLPALASTSQQPQLESPRKSSLLPAFEPVSSPLPQSSKRKLSNMLKFESKHYPTPVPTSSTGICPSSPPRRLGLHRTMSALSERSPLCSLPSVDIPLNGEPVLMGRSSNSSNYQLSTNRLISRVHVSAVYRAPDFQHASGSIEIECLGYNGVKVHCGGRVRGLVKGEKFTSIMPSAEIMLDVHDARVILVWPEVEDRGDGYMPSSPPDAQEFLARPRSPESPAPAGQTFAESTTFLAADSEGNVEIYEDAENVDPASEVVSFYRPSQSSELLNESRLSKTSSASRLDDVSDQEEENSNENEENDPIIHSFYAGDSILPRFQSISHSSPQRSRKRRRPLEAASPKRLGILEDLREETSPSPKKRSMSSPVHRSTSSTSKRVNESPIKNHVINQLAFSRIHSHPLSTIMGNLPAAMKSAAAASASRSSSDDKKDEEKQEMSELTAAELEEMLHNIPCIGEIKRQGKDAAGKPLENQFYYLPEMDSNTERRDNVVNGMGGTSLRSVRRTHKQYYWKKPKH